MVRQTLSALVLLVLVSWTPAVQAQAPSGMKLSFAEKAELSAAKAEAEALRAEAKAKAEAAKEERKIQQAAANRAAQVRRLAAANRAAAAQGRTPRPQAAPNQVRYHPRYGYMVGNYQVPSKFAYRNPYMHGGYGGHGGGYGYGGGYGHGGGYGYGSGAYGYSAPYRTPAGTAVLGPTIYPSYQQSTNVRVYRQPARTSTGTSSHYFGNPHASQYISN